MPSVAQVESLKRETEGLRQEFATVKGRVQQLRKAGKHEGSLAELKKQAAVIQEEINDLGAAYDDLIERYHELVREAEKSQRASNSSAVSEPGDPEA